MGDPPPKWEIHMEVFIVVGGIPIKWLVDFHGESDLEMDDEKLGVPRFFRKPPYGFMMSDV